MVSVAGHVSQNSELLNAYVLSSRLCGIFGYSRAHRASTSTSQLILNGIEAVIAFIGNQINLAGSKEFSALPTTPCSR